MNKIYKVVKGKVCSEHAKGAKKGAVGFTALALAMMAINANAEFDVTTQGYSSYSDKTNGISSIQISASNNAQKSGGVNNTTAPTMTDVIKALYASDPTATITVSTDSNTTKTYNSAQSMIDDLNAKIINPGAIGSALGQYSYQTKKVINNAAVGDNSVLIGNNNGSFSRGTVLIGYNNRAIDDPSYSGVRSVVIGSNNKTTDGGVAIGSGIDATGGGVVLQKGTASRGGFTVGNTATGVRSVAFGRETQATGDNSFAMGEYTIASGQDSIALGYDSSATNHRSFVLGFGSTSSGINSVVFGDKSTATGGAAFVAGLESNATGFASTAIGVGVNSTGWRSTAIGSFATASGEDAIALGNNAKSVGKGAFAAIGATAKAQNSIAMGKGAITGSSDNSSQRAIAIGENSQALADNTIAIGTGNVVKGANSGAFGNNNTINQDNTFVLGNNVKTTQANSVVLGNDSTDSAAVAVAGATIRGKDYAFAGTSPTGVVSVGSAGGERQLQNVAAGQISATSTDAINGSQLFATNQAIENLIATGAEPLAVKYDSTAKDKVTLAGTDGTTLTNVKAGTIATGSTDAVNGGQIKAIADNTTAIIGGNATTNPDGTIAVTNIGGTGQNNINDAISAVNTNIAKGINFGGTTGSNNYQLGDTISVKGDNNINSTTVAGGTQLALNPNLTLNSVTTGGVVLSSNGLDNGGNTIRNVGNAVNGTDAVNLNQLNAVAANAKTTSVVGGTNIASVTAKVDGTNTEYTINAKGTSLAAGSDAVTVTSTTDADNTTNYITDLSDATKASLIKADSALQSISSTNANILVGAKDVDGNQAITLIDNPTFAGTVTAPIFSTGVNAPTLSTTGLDAANTKITNVKAGAIATGSTDAVNGGQIKAIADNATAIIGGNATTNPDGTIAVTNIGGTGQNNINDAISAVNTNIAKGINFGGTTGSNNYQLGDTISVKGDNNINSTTVAGGTQLALNPNLTLNSVTTGGVVLSSNGLDNGGNTIRNVGNAVNGTDAVNLNQLNAVAANAKTTSVVGGTNIASVTAKVDGTNTEYTINAKGTSLAAGSDAVTVTSTTDADNTTNYITDLSDATKASLIKADSALQSISSTNANILVGAKDVDGNQAITLIDNPTFAGTVTAPIFSTGVNAPTLSTTGLDAANTKITNVKAGTIATGSTDAVNGGQIKAIADNTTAIIGGNATTNPDGTIAVTNIGGTGQNNINDAISAVNTNAVKAKSTVSQGQNIVVTPTTNTDGSTNYEVATADDIVVKSVTADKAKVGTVTADSTVTDANGNTIVTGMGVGAVNATSTDAVNGSQLYATNTKVENNAVNIANNTATIAKGLSTKTDDGKTNNLKLGDTLSVKGGSNISTSTSADGSVMVDLDKTISVDTLSINDSTVAVSKNGINAGNTKVTNVSDGEVSATSRDAVNGSQLYKSYQYMDNIRNDLGVRIDSLETDYKAAVAGAHAAASLPEVKGLGKSKLGIALGGYSDQGAIAVGYSHLSDNGKTSIKIHASGDTQGGIGGGIGWGYEW